MSTSIRLRNIDRHHPTETSKIVQLAYGKFNVPFTRIFKTNEGFKAICRDEHDADKILGKNARDELEKIGLQVLLPPEIKAKRSVFIKQVDQIIGGNTAEEIKEEIEKENEWIKVAEVVKMKNYTHLLKIRFEETTMAEKAKRQGILAYNMAISPSQIETEEYVHIVTCYKCYRMEEHITKDCPYNELLICSECGEQGHFFKDCRSQEKSCINCKRNGKPANHRTLAMACPTRKSIINDKVKAKRSTAANKEQNTYAEIAKRAVEEAKNSDKATHINLSEQKHTKILISIMHAHIMNLCNPGTYQIELNKMLQKNELPTMWFPENPDSGKLLGASATILMPDKSSDIDKTTTNTEDTIIQEEEQDLRTPKLSNRDPRLRSRSHSRPQASTSEAVTTPEGIQFPEQANEIGLKIHITGKSIVPTMDPHLEFVIQQIKTGNYKWTYTDCRFKEDQIKHLLSLHKIKITKNDFKRIDEGSFRKIRNGIDSRSPPEETRKAKK